MSAHTPGPWKARDYETDDGDIWIDCVNFTGPKVRGSSTSIAGTIATALKSGTGKSGDLRANARLIAAAPDLGEVATLIECAADAPMASGKTDGFTRPTEKQWREIVTKARAAIAKARGGR